MLPRFRFQTGVLLTVGLLVLTITNLSQQFIAAAESEYNLKEGPQTGLPEVQMRIGKGLYTLEVAETPEQAEKGLMFRKKLAAQHGMLFTFAPARSVSFWMKNTLIPLDMLFIKEGQILHIQANAQPCTEEPCDIYPSTVPVDTVIELAGGTARKHGIQPGDRIIFFPKTSKQ